MDVAAATWFHGPFTFPTLPLLLGDTADSFPDDGGNFLKADGNLLR